MKTWFEIKNATAAEADIYLYNDIGFFGVTAEQFIAELSKVTAATINLHVNSYGGEIFDGFAIYNALKRHPANIVTHIDGIAASAATYPALAGDTVNIAKNAMLMIHNPLSCVCGDAEDMRKTADVLDKLRDAIAGIYVDRTGESLDTVRGWMTEETWFNAEEAKSRGFVDAITGDSDKAPNDPKNKTGHFWNDNTVPRVRPTERIKALGLDGLLPSANAATPKEQPMTVEQFNEFAAKNPDAVKNVAKDLIEQAREAAKNEVRNELKPKNASAAELKAAFPDNRDFVLDRLDHDAPLNEHKVAFADYLAEQNKALQQEIETLKNKIAELDPGQAGEPNPLNLNKPNEGGDKPMSDERKRELLNMSPLGTAVLNRK